MEQSPKGRDIELLTGEADPIISRGNQITSLGEQMISSAAVLKSIADGASGQKGLAVDKLKEVVGQSYEELELAGKRYKPTGPVLVRYGTVLAEVQPKIKTAVTVCETEWENYLQKSGGVSEAALAYYPPPAPAADGATPEDPDKERNDATQAAQQAADAAKEQWRAEAKVFDTHYDTWEDAFDQAAADIGDATDGGISDSRWDDLDGFVAAALTVLQYVGLALAVLGILIGGPIIAALAAIVAIATLLLTIYSFSRGNSTLTDLVFAVIGVIPFGSLGKTLNGSKAAAFMDGLTGGLSNSVGRAAIRGEGGNIIYGIATGASRADGFLPSVLRGGRGGFLAWAGPNGMGTGNVLSRLFTGQNMNYFNQGGLSGVNVISAVVGDGQVKNLFGIPDSIGNGLHNDWFPSFELDTPRVGSPKR